jgi:hypothetical protein
LRIRADEHISEGIVRAVREMALSPGWELSHVIEVGDRGSTDVHWVTKFARDGGHAILSGDTDFFKRHQQVLAIKSTGMRVIHLPHRWANSRCELQASHVLLWWRRIETTIAKMAPQECYRVPWNLSEEGELLKIKIDYQDAERKAKRDETRAAKRKDEKSSDKVEGTRS